MPFIARATIDALGPSRWSTARSTWRRRRSSTAVDLGIAVDLDQGGLVVMNMPAPTGSDHRPGRGIRAVADKARAGKLEPDDCRAAPSPSPTRVRSDRSCRPRSSTCPRWRSCRPTPSPSGRRWSRSRGERHDRHPPHRLPGPDLGSPGFRWVHRGAVPAPDQGEPGDLGLGAGTGVTPNAVRARWLGRLPYPEAWDLQRHSGRAGSRGAPMTTTCCSSSTPTPTRWGGTGMAPTCCFPRACWRRSAPSSRRRSWRRYHLPRARPTGWLSDRRCADAAEWLGHGRPCPRIENADRGSRRSRGGGRAEDGLTGRVDRSGQGGGDRRAGRPRRHHARLRAQRQPRPRSTSATSFPAASPSGR